jgi:hypothetical protein
MLTAPAGVVGPASIASYAGVFTQSLKNGARASSIGARAVFSGRARMFHVSEDSGGDVSEDSGRNTGVQASELFENSVGSSNAGMASPLCEKFEDSASRRGGRPSRRSRRQMLAQAMLSASAVLSVAPGALVRSAAAASAGAPGAAAAEGQSGFVSGIAVSLVKQTVLYPIDTVKVRLQTTPLAAGEAVWTRAGLFRGLYRGFLLPLIFNAPAGGVFFAAKDAVKSSLANLGNIPSTLVAIFVAQFPYWLVRQPSEVLKVRRQAVCAFGNAAGAGAAPGEEQGWGGIAAALRESAELLDVRKPGTVESLSLGFGSNLAYTFPADALKFMAYDYLKVSPRGYLAGTVVNSRLRCTLRIMHYASVTLCESSERGTQSSS